VDAAGFVVAGFVAHVLEAAVDDRLERIKAPLRFSFRLVPALPAPPLRPA
jgi:hypothetical protein